MQKPSKQQKKKTASKRSSQGKAQQQELQKQKRSALALLLAALFSSCSFFLLSYSLQETHPFGVVGAMVAWMFQALFGIGSYLLLIFLCWIGWRRLNDRSVHRLGVRSFALLLALFAISWTFSLLEELLPPLYEALSALVNRGLWSRHHYVHLGGALPYYLFKDLPQYNLLTLINAWGVLLLSFLLFICAISLFYRIHPLDLAWRALQSLKIPRRASPVPLQLEKGSLSSPEGTLSSLRAQAVKAEPALPRAVRPAGEPTVSFGNSFDAKGSPSQTKESETLRQKPLTSGPLAASVPSAGTVAEASRRTAQIKPGDFSAYQLPPATLLNEPTTCDLSLLKKGLKDLAQSLEETFANFGIEAHVGQINCGPTITSFEVHPATGVKVQRIKALENDIALNLRAKAIRIVAPIPGKAAVGVEIPNPDPQLVSFRELLQAYSGLKQRYRIPMLLGKAVNGEYVMSDLAKLPHCIIAGATGSGKSVCLNTIVASIILTAKPDQIKMIMVDPKKVELTPYTNLPHMLAPVITEAQGACTALKWLVKEMERRYAHLKATGTRNIASFNERKAAPDEPEKTPTFLCDIVVIIDELADLMMVASGDIETPIARLAQMARAVGIHLILATQRPSREVITGLIKANFPARIAFKVASRVNSQIILDEPGAESLLGNGDMLFLPPGIAAPLRAQGAYLSDSELHRLIDFICQQSPPQYAISSFDTPDFGELFDDDSTGDDGEAGDELYADAFDIVTSTGNASTTFLQRKLKIGYARAASLMDLLEKRGVVSPPDGSRARQVLRK